jgi:subfamily B ATP-binding cassette protein MsbA
LHPDVAPVLTFAGKVITVQIAMSRESATRGKWDGMKKRWHLFRYFLPYWPLFVLAVLLMAAMAAFQGLAAALIKPVVDKIVFVSHAPRVELLAIPFTPHKLYLDQVNPFPFQDPVLVIGLLLILATLIKGVAEYFSVYLLNYMGQAVVKDLRNQLYEKIMHQSVSFFHAHPTGRLISRVLNDIEKIQFACSTVLADALKQSFLLVTFLSIAFSKDAALTLASFLLAPLVIYPSRYFGRKVRRSSRSSQERMEEISHILQETITGQRVVKAFMMENFELARFKQSTKRLARVNMNWIRMQTMASPYMELVGAIAIGGMLFYIHPRIVKGIMQPGDVALFMTALLLLYNPIRRMNGIYNTFQQAKGATSKVFEMMEEHPDVQEKKGALTLEKFQDAIEFRQVSFNYNDSRIPVLKNIQLKVRKGELVAFVGSSGSGKTTLVNLLPRFYDPSDGQILIDGIDLRDLSFRSLRSTIGMVGQDTILFNDTVRNNICYGRQQVNESEMTEASQAALAHDFIMELPARYDSVIGERGMKLSGGQRQRIAIARALLKNSPILILDEATSALDSESEILVQKALANLMQGRTVFVIAHRLSTIRQADRIVVISRGEISEIGTHTDLLAKGGIYQRLYDLQFADVDADFAE